MANNTGYKNYTQQKAILSATEAAHLMSTHT